jgi:hypothetical protein
MSWASLASNQAVSCENLQDAVTNGIFTIKNTIPSSTPAKYKCVTKADADYYVNINTSNPGYVAKASNQLVVKDDLSSGAAPTYITISSGLYPVTGPNTTITGYIYNNTASDIYVVLVFNSGGQGSGSIAQNVDTLNVYVPGTIRTISVYGTITSFGTTLTSATNSPAINGIITIAANSAPFFFIDKFDGFGSGSTLRIYYSNIFGGPYSPIPV